ncbi:MAG TPA: ATP-binding cassette domain-containing protein [Thermoanaerobaculia bacterium]|nr:ATP-binding cassette domain-containing protein [Thermoanaerobaculia bacterium]
MGCPRNRGNFKGQVWLQVGSRGMEGGRRGTLALKSANWRLHRLSASLAPVAVRELSIGQRRRAVLVAALIGAPDHLLLDEPCETLDRRARDTVLAWIEARRRAAAPKCVLGESLDSSRIS